MFRSAAHLFVYGTLRSGSRNPHARFLAANATLIGPARMVVAIFSYDGGLYFGVTGDADSAADIGVLTAGIERGMSELLALVESPRQAPAPAPRGAGKPAPS